MKCKIQINGNGQAGPPTMFAPRKKEGSASRLQKYASPLQSRPASPGPEASLLPAVVALPVAVVVAMPAAGPAGTAAAQVCQC